VRAAAIDNRFLGNEEGRHQTRSTVLSIQPTNRPSSLARGRDYRYRDGFSVLIDFPSQLNASTSIRSEGREALVLDVIDFVTGRRSRNRSQRLPGSEAAVNVVQSFPSRTSPSGQRTNLGQSGSGSKRMFVAHWPTPSDSSAVRWTTAGRGIMIRTRLERTACCFPQPMGAPLPHSAGGPTSGR
jgi:hypothetical protein